MAESVHTMPVPPGWSPEQVWEAHSRGKKLPTNYSNDQQRWAVLTIEGGEQVGEFWCGGTLKKCHWVEDEDRG